MSRTILSSVFVAITVLAAPALAEVDVNVSIGLPVLAVGPEPVMAVIPGTYVYFVLDLDSDLFFYQGYWWRVHNGRWYRAAAPGGPWRFFRKVPRPLLSLPPGWRNLPAGHVRLKHAEVKNNWRQWEKEKRWEKHKGHGAEDSKPLKANEKGDKKKPAKLKGGNR